MDTGCWDGSEVESEGSEFETASRLDWMDRDDGPEEEKGPGDIM